MEQHQIPKNVTSFQFKLIGDMTLRQFAYCCFGLLFAYLTYRLIPLPKLVTIPFAGAVLFGGFAAAFIPIQDRPLEKWLAAFIKSIYSPTQFIWRKEGTLPEVLTRPSSGYVQILTERELDNHKYAREKLNSYLASIPKAPHTNINIYEKKYIDHTVSLFNAIETKMPKEIQAQSLPEKNPSLEVKIALQPTPQVENPPTEKIVSVDKPVEEKTVPKGEFMPEYVEDKKRDIAPVITSTSSLLVEEQLKKLMEEKENLAKQLEFLKQEMKNNRPQADQQIQNVRPLNVKPQTPQPVPSRFPAVPNLITGAVKDTAGKLLPNIIITIKDIKGMPLRALKTNKLGQFETATPLPNAVYHLEIEDPQKKFTFDVCQITLSGKPVQPVLITAKGEKEIMREKLAREIFGNAMM